MNDKKLWFKKKRYGWGWTPSSWEGWLIAVVYMIAIFSSAFRVEKNKTIYIPIFIFANLFLIYILQKKGEKVDWNKFKQD